MFQHVSSLSLHPGWKLQASSVGNPVATEPGHSTGRSWSCLTQDWWKRSQRIPLRGQTQFQLPVGLIVELEPQQLNAWYATTINDCQGRKSVTVDLATIVYNPILLISNTT
jgi:hypothetical protein